MLYKSNGVYNTVCPRDCFGGCSLKVTISNNKITKVTGNENNDNSSGKLCVKGVSYSKRLYHKDRLKYPMLKNKSTKQFERISWNEVFDLLKTKLIKTKNIYGDDSIMYLSGWGHTGILNDYSKSFWSQFGNITTTYGSLCMAAGKSAYKYTYGDVVKHNNNNDLINSKLIIIWGANPANTNIHRMRNIKKAIQKGCELIVIDPRISESMIEGSLKIHPRVGTDGLLAMGISKLLIKNNLCNLKFIDENVLGFEEYKNSLEEYTLDEIVKLTEVSLKDIEKIVELIEKNPIYALVTGTGKSRYTNGGQTERAIAVLPALTGSIGVKGGGIYFSDSQTPSVSWKNYPLHMYNMFEKIHVGRLAHEMEELKNKIRFLWIEKANPLTSNPDVNFTKKTFESIDFIVVVDHFFTDTTDLADLVLPAAMFAEKDDLISVYGDSYIQLLQKLIPPLEECKSEPEIYRLLGEKFHFDMKYLPEINEDLIDKILLDNNINTSYKKLIEKPFLYKEYKDIAYEDLKFATPSGKIEFYSKDISKWHTSKLPKYKEPVESKYSTPKLFEKYPLNFLSTHPSERINSQFTEMNLSKKRIEPTVEISSIDAINRNIRNDDMVKVFNDRGEVIIKAEISNAAKSGLIHIYEGWGDKYKASVNKLTSARVTDIGNGTSFHDCLVEVKKYNY